jgi:hypothetical protein
MRTDIVNRCVEKFQDQLYEDLHVCAEGNRRVALLAGIPVAIFDGIAETSKSFFKAIESFVLCMFSYAEAFWGMIKKDSLHDIKDHYYDALYHSDRLVKHSALLSMVCVVTPIKVCVQMFIILSDPSEAVSMYHALHRKENDLIKREVLTTQATAREA